MQECTLLNDLFELRKAVFKVHCGYKVNSALFGSLSQLVFDDLALSVDHELVVEARLDLLSLRQLMQRPLPILVLALEEVGEVDADLDVLGELGN